MDIRENINGIQHIGLPTKDLQATIDFYGRFGFEVEWKGMTPAGENVAFLRCGNCVYETYDCPEPVGASGAIDHISLDVKDIEAAYEYVRAQGFEALQGEICFLPFYEKGVRFFTIEGPNAEKLEFNQKL